MKKQTLVIPFVALALLSTSCGGNKNNGNLDSEQADGANNNITSMKDYKLEETTTVGPHTYRYVIVRKADASLSTVTDDMGDTYADNYIQLTISRDGQQYFDHRFTKDTFNSSLDEEFAKNAILDGIRFMSGEAGKGLTFSFSVSYPESDMTCPFSLTVADDGSYSFIKDDVMDMENDAQEVDDDADGV